jgi:transposase
MQRYALRDDQWIKIKDFLPGREGHVGIPATDNRWFVDAIIYRTRTGIQWCDLPERYGDWKATHKRLRRWGESSVLARILEVLALEADAEVMSID